MKNRIRWVVGVVLVLGIGLLGVRVAVAQQRLNQAFERVDANGDGKLSTVEVNRFAPIKGRLADADTDDDGYVSKTEYWQAIAKGYQAPKATSGKLAAGDASVP